MRAHAFFFFLVSHSDQFLDQFGITLSVGKSELHNGIKYSSKRMFEPSVTTSLVRFIFKTKRHKQLNNV